MSLFLRYNNLMGNLLLQWGCGVREDYAIEPLILY